MFFAHHATHCVGETQRVIADELTSFEPAQAESSLANPIRGQISYDQVRFQLRRYSNNCFNTNHGIVRTIGPGIFF